MRKVRKWAGWVSLIGFGASAITPLWLNLLTQINPELRTTGYIHGILAAAAIYVGLATGVVAGVVYIVARLRSRRT